MFEFDYTITEKDYSDFNQYHWIHSPVGKKNRHIYILLLPLILVMLLIIDVASGKIDHILSKVLIYTVYSGVWALILGPLMRLNIKFSTNLMKKNGKLPYDSKVILKFDDEFLYEKAALMEIKMSYAKLERIAVGESGVYLYHTVLAAFLIPNHVFTNTVQKYDFLQFVHQKTNLPIEGIL